MTTSNSVLSISLGGRIFQVRPLTLGQIEQLAAASDAFGGADQSAKVSVAAARRVVAAALSRDNPQEAENDCGALEASWPELLAASDTILVHSGLVKAKDTGEATAGAAA